MKRMGVLAATVMALMIDVTLSHPAAAWGDEGHEVIALIAQAIAAAATWPDKLRNLNEHGARQRTSQWHFVDIEVAAPDLNQACFGHPPVPNGKPASSGPAQDCVVDKIQEFAAELANPAISPEEQIVALKFLLHFVGDLHQPLHAADDHDRGGNNKRVSADGFKAGNLHQYWDTAFVNRLGATASRVAADLNGRISTDQLQAWSQGGPSAWALESFRVARDDAYGQLPKPDARGRYRLPDGYIAMATQDVAVQLSQAACGLPSC